MAVGPFLSDDTGFVTLLSTGSWAADDVYAVLVTTDQTITRGAQTYANITANVVATAIQAVAGKSVTEASDKVMFDHSKITFTSSGSLSGRYVYYLFGDTTPVAGDVVIGYVDLNTGGGNVSSIDAEFSFDPSVSNGLFEVARSVAA